MKAVRALRSSDAASLELPVAAAPSAPASAPAPAPAKPAESAVDTAAINREVLSDPAVTAILASLPGAAVMGISERKRA